MSEYTYKTRGVCARQIDFEIDGDVLRNVRFTGGCDGNLRAISKLVDGMPVDDVASLLEGNTCGPKSTSCADQLAQAIKQAKA
ncbi:TIGR03905 family TSCPD domain-containing protein [Adlercreutzia sp. ZJ154]|uniref:TIGR03905 family TSCPD domain-containing protein n=1 Tax=Adlercreutzia sp. ZJ154 TaxID=2709790 RepID=UPI0013EDA04E|nr:TIGR03905 family TSCPD domain-containing protein [Adlercreutzia sp. ZJ154]